MTPQTIAVLAAILDSPGAAGADISRSTQIPSGTLYPILLRLEEAAWLQSQWEDSSPRSLGRPRRRFYHVTGTGAAALREIAKTMSPIFQRFAYS